MTINLLAQRRVFPDAPDIAYHRAFLGVLLAMRNLATNNNEKVEFTFDMRRESDHNAGLLYGMFRDLPNSVEVVASKISFVFSREYQRVQVADLFAREIMKDLDNKIGPKKRDPRKSWMALEATNRFHVEILGDEWFDDLKSRMADLEKDLGMSRAQYLLWLGENKLQDNTTNLFHYVQWTTEQEKPASCLDSVVPSP